MSDATIDIDVNGNIFEEIKILKSAFVGLKDSVDKIEQSSDKAFKSLKDDVKGISLNALTESFERAGQALGSLSAPGLKYNASMTELKAMAGLTTKELNNLGAMARENAKTFGGDAAKSVETYKLLIAQLGPEIAKQPKVLNAMAQNAEILAKSMGNDVVGAAGVLSTAMHQYGVDLTDAKGAQEEMTKMMNAMSASANAGASELPQLQQAVGVAGGAAKRAGVDFEQMLTAIQFLDNASYKASEGGTALRKVLDTLGKGRFLPENVRDELEAANIDIDKLADTTVSFTDKMRMLQPIAKDTALIGALFGGPYAGAAQALIATADAQDEMTKSITGTTEAQDYAATMMESYEEKLGRMNAVIDDMKVSVFEATGGYIAFAQPLAEVATEFNSLRTAGVGVWDMMKSGGESLKDGVQWLGKTKVGTMAVTAAQWLWNAAMNANPIGLIITGVAALGVGVYALTKAFNKASEAEKAHTRVQDLVAESTVKERTEVTILFDRLKNAKKGTDEYKSALQELGQKYPGLIEKFNLHKGRIKDIEAAEKDLMGTIQKRAEVQARAQVYQDMVAENIKERNRIEQMRRDGKGVSSWSNGFVWGEDSIKDSEKALKERESAAKNLLKEVVKDEKKKAKDSENASKTDTDPENTIIPDLTVKKKKKKKSTSSSSTSGSEKRNISVKIDKLVENITIQTTNLKEGLGDVKKQVTEALVGAVRDFEIAI